MSNEQLLASSRRQHVDGMPESATKRTIENPLSTQYADHVLAKLVAQNNGSGDSIDYTKSTESTATAEEKFAQAHKVNITHAQDKFVYSMQYGGTDHRLFETSADLAGLDSAAAKLRSLVSEEEKSLTTTYGVTFARAGEFVARQKERSDSPDLDHAVVAREPELYELEGIRAALAKSGASSIAADGETGVKFYAMSEKPILGIDSLATFQNDKNNNPSIYLWPKFSDIGIVTEQDRTPAQKLAYTDGRREESIEGAIIHELGHHQFSKLGFDPKTNANGLAAETALFERMGWKKRLDETDADYNWLLQGKRKSDNGENSTYLPSFSGMFFTFNRWRQKGGPEDAHGKLVAATNIEKLSEDEMEAEAKVTPPTWYFENPEEEYAEAVRLFRTSAESRDSLRRTSPELFTLMQENEQKELDQLKRKTADSR